MGAEGLGKVAAKITERPKRLIEGAKKIRAKRVESFHANGKRTLPERLFGRHERAVQRNESPGRELEMLAAGAATASSADLPASEPRVEKLGAQAQLTPDGAQVTPDGAGDALGTDIQRLMDAGNSEEQAKAILANNALQAANNSQPGENTANTTTSTEPITQPVSTSAETSAPVTVDAIGTNPNLARDQSAADAVVATFTEEPGGQSGQSTTSNDADPIHIKLSPNTTQAPDSTFTAAQTHTAGPGNVHRATPASHQTFDASVPGNASGSPDAPTNGNAPGSADTSPATSTPDASGDSAVDTDADTTATGTGTPDATASSTSTPDTTTVDPKESLRAPLREDLKAAKYALDHLDRTKPDFVTVRDNLRAEIRNLGRELDYVDFPEHRKRDMIEDYRSMRGRLAHAKSSEEAAGMLADANELRDKIIDLDARGLPGVDIARAARGVIDGMPNSSRFRKFDFRKRDMNRFGKELRWMQKGLQGDMDALKRLAYMPPDIIDMSADKEMVKLLRRIHQQNMAPQSFGEFAGNLAQKIFNRKNYKAKYAERARLAAADQATALTASPEELDKIQRKYGKKIPWWMNILLTVGMAITAEVINDIGPAAFQDASGRQ